MYVLCYFITHFLEKYEVQRSNNVENTALSLFELKNNDETKALNYEFNRKN